ncbi:hypothetical protein L6452_10728 [Arctium lappa]|uniref:Uncharacterized protein n=1 Tax=Arctium lappa TaxID=4217 RepID=A0ACB9DNQ7_ARCLA|nr:hypothetical protein L6452_10728 [Arctium lappa]
MGFNLTYFGSYKVLLENNIHVVIDLLFIWPRSFFANNVENPNHTRKPTPTNPPTRDRTTVAVAFLTEVSNSYICASSDQISS